MKNDDRKQQQTACTISDAFELVDCILCPIIETGRGAALPVYAGQLGCVTRRSTVNRLNPFFLRDNAIYLVISNETTVI